MISFYLKDISLKSIIENKNILEIKCLDKTYNSKIPLDLNSLKKIETGCGYLILSSTSTKITIKGEENKEKTYISLNKGWNLLGYPFKLKQDLKIDPKIKEIKNVDKIYNDSLPKNLNTLKEFKKGEAYWCKCSEDMKLELDYPFKFIQKDSNNEIYGLIHNEEISRLELEYKYTQQTYKIDITEKTEYNIPWNINFGREEIEFIRNSFRNLIFTVYFDNDEKVVALNLHNKLKVPSNFNGNINLSYSSFTKYSKLIILYFNDSRKRIVLNFSSKLILIGDDYKLEFTNIKFSLIEVKNKNEEESNYIEDKDKENNSLFLADYDLKNININEINITKDEELLEIKEIKTSHDPNLSLKIFSDTIYIIIKLKREDSPNKIINVDFLTEDGDSIKNINKQIIYNKMFKLKVGKQNYSISFKWDTEIEDTKFPISKFTTSTEYLYWFNFNNIQFNNIQINNSTILDINYIERNKDYIIFESEIDNYYYNFFLMKDKLFRGCIIVFISYRKTSNTVFNENSIRFNWTIYNNISFNIYGNEFKFNWSGNFDSNGYSIRNTDIFKQRVFARDLNTFKEIEINNFKIKVHYQIGSSNNSLNLNNWGSYNNFLETLEKLLRYLFEYLSLYQLKLPLSDESLNANGGDSSYDIYITEIENSNIKGFTKGEAFASHTINPNDVITYMVLSNNLNYDWLKTVLFHEFFHSIQGSYDWFDEGWIDEGLAVSFEVGLSNNSISSKYFIPNFLEKKNLALSYISSFEIDQEGVIESRPLSVYDGIKGDAIIEMTDVYSDWNKLDLDNLTKSDLTIIPINNNSIYISKVVTEDYRGQNILRIFLNSNKSTENLKFKLKIGNNNITEAESAFRSRHYGTFIFFRYLIDKYDNNLIYKYFMESSAEYNGYKVIENVIRRIDFKLNFIDEVIDFWCATEILSNSDNIEKKYRLELSHILNMIFLLDTSNKIEITNTEKIFTIEDLEPTGCITLDLDFKESEKAIFKINGYMNYLHFRIICEYTDKTFKVIKIGKDNEFIITIDSSLLKTKLLIVGDLKLPPNKNIEIKYKTNIEEETNPINKSLIKFTINVIKKN